MLNKTVSGLYSPGSTIKPLVALSALENDVITTNLKVNCRGHKHPLELYGMKYHCWKKQGHGYMSLQNAIKQSCDTYFYEAARLLGVDRLNITAENFHWILFTYVWSGLTGIDGFRRSCISIFKVI